MKYSESGAISRGQDLNTLIFVLTFSAILLIPHVLFAVDVGAALCNIADNMDGTSGTAATGIATMGVATIGVLATLGRISWTQAVVVAAGIGGLFGATTIVSLIYPAATACS